MPASRSLPGGLQELEPAQRSTSHLMHVEHEGAFPKSGIH
jgi:hypothetical protein